MMKNNIVKRKYLVLISLCMFNLSNLISQSVEKEGLFDNCIKITRGYNYGVPPFSNTFEYFTAKYEPNLFLRPRCFDGIIPRVDVYRKCVFCSWCTQNQCNEEYSLYKTVYLSNIEKHIGDFSSFALNSKRYSYKLVCNSWIVELSPDDYNFPRKSRDDDSYESEELYLVHESGRVAFGFNTETMQFETFNTDDLESSDLKLQTTFYVSIGTGPKSNLFDLAIKQGDKLFSIYLNSNENDKTDGKPIFKLKGNRIFGFKKNLITKTNSTNHFSISYAEETGLHPGSPGKEYKVIYTLDLNHFNNDMTRAYYPIFLNMDNTYLGNDKVIEALQLRFSDGWTFKNKFK